MSTGVPETFDEHERDTAQRETPPELLEVKRTTKMAKVDLNALRTAASGARRALSDAAIEQHARESEHREEAIEPDAHTRPTLANLQPAQPIAPPLAPPRTTIPAWVVAFLMFGILAIIAASGTVGFALGRASR